MWSTLTTEMVGFQISRAYRAALIVRSKAGYNHHKGKSGWNGSLQVGWRLFLSIYGNVYLYKGKTDGQPTNVMFNT